MNQKCELIKEFILENNIVDTNYVFRVIDFNDKYIDIEPSEDLDVSYDDEVMTFYNGGTEINSMSVEDLNCVFIEDKE